MQLVGLIATSIYASAVAQNTLNTTGNARVEPSLNSYQLLVALLPPGAGTHQPIKRFNVEGPGGAMTSLSDIPPELTDDPAGLAFRTSREMFVGNRHGNTGAGSVSRFTFDQQFNSFTQEPNITGNGLANCHQVSFDSVSGELFVADMFVGSVSRFIFDSLGHVIENSIFSPGCSGVGVVVSSDGQELFFACYSSTEIKRFGRVGNGFAPLGSIQVSGASRIHYLKFREGELYASDIDRGLTYRIAF
ncbi:MAG: hypothetical protein B6D36_08370 [Planctomycetes bacterium UTPLA1]|nr:MAG: hypothetical protein B6D36_08370 [Planctomycetes bacterium UTPLA1]